MKTRANALFLNIILNAFALLMALLVTPHLFAAESITGVVDVRSDIFYIRLQPNREPLRLVGMTALITTDLQRLATGDIVMGTGTIFPDRKMVALDSIDTVGLRQVLGIWRTPKWQVFEFKDFSRLNIYMSQGRAPAPPSLHRELNYTLAPNSDNRSWSIFMADRNGVHIGSMDFNDRRMNLRVYDTETGSVEQTYELLPVLLKQ